MNSKSIRFLLLSNIRSQVFKLYFSRFRALLCHQSTVTETDSFLVESEPTGISTSMLYRYYITFKFCQFDSDVQTLLFCPTLNLAVTPNLKLEPCASMLKLWSNIIVNSCSFANSRRFTNAHHENCHLKVNSYLHIRCVMLSNL